MFRRILLFTLILGFSSFGFAQDDDNSTSKKSTSSKLNENADRLVVELNHNNWLNTPDSIDVEWFSRGINFYVMYDVKLGNSPISVAPGLGVANRNIFHNSAVVEDTFNTYLRPYPANFEFKKNKIATTYIDVPVELRFRSKPSKSGNSFKLAVGFKAGYLLHSHTKLKTSSRFSNVKNYKENNIRNMNKFRYGGTFRIGYSDINIVAFYSLTTLFEENAGPGLIPFSIGVAFNGL